MLRYRRASAFIFRYVRLLAALSVCSALLILVLLHARRPVSDEVYASDDPWLEADSRSVGGPCRMPVLHLDTPELREFFTDPAPLKCDKEPGWVRVVGGSRVEISDAARRKHGTVKCQVADLLRKNDDKTVEGFATNIETDYTLRTSDYVRVTCSATDSATWSSVLAGVRKDAAPHAVPLSKLRKDHAQLNVLFIGTDSLSRNTFLRKLPKTSAFLRDTLGAIMLEGYNIVGDGTPQALTPILTGRTEPELPEARRTVWASQYVDVYPFVWRDYQRDGYVTAYLEDEPFIGTYQYRLNGFDKPPADHYMRSFWIAVKNERGHSELCLRDLPQHKVQYNMIESLWDAYPDRAKFVFSFQSGLSHDDINKVAVADDDFHDMLSRMWKTGRLNDTVLVVMSDHGHRFAAFRNTVQGKLEERLPYFVWAMPEQFRRKYPEAMQALREHAQQLTTPFDQFFTLQHLRQWPEGPAADARGRGRSMLAAGRPRGCAECGVLPHWCACVSRRNLTANHPAIAAAAYAFETYVNSLQQAEAAGLCAPLRVYRVTLAEEVRPQRAVQAFVKSSDRDGREADLSGQLQVAEQTLQLRLEARPGRRMFELTASRQLPDGRFSVRHQDVSRTDRYGAQARCVQHRLDHMRKFCYCL